MNILRIFTKTHPIVGYLQILNNFPRNVYNSQGQWGNPGRELHGEALWTQHNTEAIVYL